MTVFRIITVLICVVTCMGSVAAAQDRATLQMQDFATLPVLHEGRVKPLASFAAVELDKFSARSSTADPVSWLAETLFNPQYAIKRPVFKVAHPTLRKRLNLPERPGKLYSLEELALGLEQTQQQALQLIVSEEKNLTPEQQALITLHENALAYGQLLQALAALLPMQVGLPESLNITPQIYTGMPTFLEIRNKEKPLMEQVKAIIDRKGEDLERYTAEEKALAGLAFEYQQISQAAARNTLLRIIPPQWKDSDVWLSPWSLLQQGQGSPESKILLEDWQAMAKAYRAANAGEWEKAGKATFKDTTAQSPDKGLGARLKMERLYNLLSPFKLAFALYALALLGGGIFLWRRHPVLYQAAFTMLIAGTAAHLAGTGLRVGILERPPVGSLYESLLFVGLIITLTALWIETRRRDALALTGAAAASLAVLFVAPVVAPDGDDLEVLVAVLNTNFWLATHVTCITAGYGFCLLTSALAHIWLLRAGGAAQVQDGLSRTIYILSLAALFLTAFGTVLGGIWADQSWGRFWGWDPKENGALLIVLWLVWLHHGRLGGQLGMPLFQAGLAVLSIIVALAWFGVNLLSVGLHSYGFTSGIAAGLAAFCAGELALTAALYYRVRHKKAGSS
ncbi:MAG: cytochrome c biogenesis protein CcsA [Rhodospirillales bacterium]|nr:cytochrome c biogenesis protein CcsA [Rhodospirillales bacterium]MCB9996234.1 cytochrome c biogenesis protein CcsA [Rhodospirillales bacterium]